MECKVTQCTIENGVGTVYLHRPGRGNSWTQQMNREYRWRMAQLDDDPEVRVIVVTGTGRQFCVGADMKALDHYSEGDEDYAESVRDDAMEKPGFGVRPEYDHDMVWHWGLRKPVIGAINGACAGIAVTLAAFCDLRYGAAGTKFTTAGPRLGLPSEYGLSWALPRLVGVTHAADIMLTGRIFLAEEAAAMGFLNAVYPFEEFSERVAETANHMASQASPAAMLTTKRQLYAELIQHDVGKSVEESKDRIGEHMRNADYSEGVQAFQDGRAPKFAPLAKKNG